MLEGIAIELRIVVEVIGVRKEVAARTEHIATAHIGRWQSHLLRACDFKTVLCTTIQCLTHLVAQVRIGVLIANNLYRIRHACSTMIGREYHFVPQRSNLLEHLRRRRVLKPTQCQTAISRLVIRQLTHHLAVSTRVREHIYKIDNRYIQRGLQPLKLAGDLLAEVTLVNLVISIIVALAIAVQQGLDQCFFVVVLAFLFILVYPQVRVHLLYLRGHQA